MISAMPLEPNRAEAERFLTALDPDASRWTFQAFDDDPERRERKREAGEKDPFAKIIHGPLAACWTQMVKLNEQGAGIFVCVNQTDFKGRSISNIVAVRAVFVDLDGAPLQPVLDHPLKPHIIIVSSPGKFHAYWRVTGMPLDQFEPTQKAIAACFNGDPRVCDLCRVMRLPGFLHQKGEPALSRMQVAGHA